MKTVLVIDGNEHIQSTVKHVLYSQYKVFQAKNLKEVLNFLQKNIEKIDAILISRFLNGRERTDALSLSIKESGFSGRMIAFWDESEDMEIQLKNGCTDEISKTNLGLTTLKLNKILSKKNIKTKAL
jgi:DNA-binding NtrC family response regulator